MKFTSVLAIVAACAVASGTAIPSEDTSSSSKPQCGPRVVSLATGIHLNIDGQHAELAATKALQKIESSKPVNETAFLIGKGELLADIAAGMTIRKYNQAVAPKHNPANPGLAKYAAAQGAEQKLAESLNGNPSHDDSILKTLVSDITSGTMLNEQNFKNATKHCSLGFKVPKQ